MTRGLRHMLLFGLLWAFSCLVSPSFAPLGFGAVAHAEDDGPPQRKKKPSANKKRRKKKRAAQRRRGRARQRSRAQRRPQAEAKPKSDAKKERGPGEAEADAAADAAADADSEIVREGDTDVKVMSFSGLDVEGRLKSPQLLYFVNRVRAEFDRPSLPHRSFMPELQRSTKGDELK